MSQKYKFSEWDSLQREMFPHPVELFLGYLDAPSSNIGEINRSTVFYEFPDSLRIFLYQLPIDHPPMGG